MRRRRSTPASRFLLLVLLALVLPACRQLAGYAMAPGLDALPVPDAPRPSDITAGVEDVGVGVGLEGLIPSACRSISVPGEPTFTDVAGSGPESVYAVGALGSIHQLTATQADFVYQAGRGLQGIWVERAGTFVAAGNEGLVVISDGTGYFSEVLWGSANHTDVFGRLESKGYAYYVVNEAGELWRYDVAAGGEWQKTWYKEVWSGLTGFGTELIAVGSIGSTGGLLRMTSGGAWLNSATAGAPLLAVSSPGSAQGTIAGGGDAFLKHDGLTWRSTTVPGSPMLKAAWALSTTEALVAGAGGVVLHIQGDTPSPLTSIAGCAMTSDIEIASIWGQNRRVVLVGKSGAGASVATAWWADIP